MHNQVLIAYASRRDSTEEIAEAIAKTLREGGTPVDVLPIETIHDLTPYRAVIVGGTVNQNEWSPEAIQFIDAHRPTLSQLPVAYFAVSTALKEDSPSSRLRIEAVLDAVREDIPEVQPFDIGVFNGVLGYDDLGLLDRVATRVGLVKAEFQDGAEIRYWAVDLRRMLSQAA